MTPAEIHKAGEELAARTRKAQGLPAKVRDVQTARRIAALLAKGVADGSP